MRRPTCARCEEILETKGAAHYWALRDDARVRSAWKQLICVGCMGPTMSIVKANREGYDGCLACGQLKMEEGSYHQLWLTLYIPGTEPANYVVELCDDCQDAAVSETRANSQLLPDRRANAGSERGAPLPDPWEAFR